MNQLWIDVLFFLCGVCAIIAVMPTEQRPKLPRLGAAPKPLVSIPGLVGSQRGPLGLVLAKLGMLIPHGRWSEEFRNAAIYPGSLMTNEEFRGLKCLAGLGSGLLFASISLELKMFQPLWFVCAIALGFLLPEVWRRSRIKQRNERVLRLLPEVIDLLTLCVGAGVDFLGAINRVVSVKEYRREPLVEELSVALQEMKFGKRKAEALKAMARRVNLQELTSFVRAIVLADRMGTPIADVLAVHAEDVRLMRYNRAERAALKAPIKILGPLIFCIMPCVAIIVGAPVFLQFLRQNPFAK